MRLARPVNRNDGFKTSIYFPLACMQTANESLRAKEKNKFLLRWISSRLTRTNDKRMITFMKFMDGEWDRASLLQSTIAVVHRGGIANKDKRWSSHKRISVWHSRHKNVITFDPRAQTRAGNARTLEKPPCFSCLLGCDTQPSKLEYRGNLHLKDLKSSPR